MSIEEVSREHKVAWKKTLIEPSERLLDISLAARSYEDLRQRALQKNLAGGLPP